MTAADRQERGPALHGLAHGFALLLQEVGRDERQLERTPRVVFHTYAFGLHASVLESDSHVLGPQTRADHDVYPLLETFELDVPQPRHVGSIGEQVVDGDQQGAPAGWR